MVLSYDHNGVGIYNSDIASGRVGRISMIHVEADKKGKVTYNILYVVSNMSFLCYVHRPLTINDQYRGMR